MPAIDEIKVYANYQGAVNGGQLPRTIYVPRYRGGENVSSTTTYGLTVPAGVTAAIDDTADSETRRSEEHTSELQSIMRISYAVFCLKKQKNINIYNTLL